MHVGFKKWRQSLRFKNNICIDVDHGLIRRYAVTPAHRHDRQMLPCLLDFENEHNSVWADFAYAGECFETLLNLGGFETCIHENGSRNHPLSGAAKQRNRIKSAIRACVEYVVGCMIMSMGGKMTRKIGLERNKAWWCLKNLILNFLRYFQRANHVPALA